MKKRIAIVGGGISGLYAAWRLKEMGDFDISVYEAADRLGGRIKTVEFGIDSNGQAGRARLKAELGAMRFPTQHKLLLSLCKKLGFDGIDTSSKPEAWRGPFQLKSLFHLRGKILSKESFRGGDIPYRVRPEEQGKTPEALLEYAIFSMLDKMLDERARATDADPDSTKFLKDFRDRLKDNALPTAAEWTTFMTNDYTFAGIPLRNIGFWNVLKHFLSSEAFLLVHDGFGFLSVISNWSAPQAFKWLLTDFSPHQRLQTLPGGLSNIVNALTEKLGTGVTHEKHAVRVVRRLPDGFELQFADESKPSVKFDYVILAMPPSALRRIRLHDGDHEINSGVDTQWRALVQCSRPHRLAKVVLAYEEPWWEHTRVPGAESGRLFTDLPMRQIHYFGPSWLAQNGWGPATPSRYSLVMVYNDSHYEAFWRTFHIHDKVSRSAAARKEHPDKTLGQRPGEIATGRCTFIPPSQLAGAASTPVDEYEVRLRMEEKVRAQLSELHDYEVPMAIGGVYKDWSEDGGWHTWEPFVDVLEAKSAILQPFSKAGDRLAVHVCGEPVDGERLPLYVCGEAYAWEQGWIEGALMTAERVVAEIATPSNYARPTWFYGASFDDYMFAEFRGFELPRAGATGAAAK